MPPSSDVSALPPKERGAPSMLFSDPPVHHRLRKLVSVAFSQSIEKQEAQIALVAGRCDTMPTNAEVDLVQALATVTGDGYCRNAWGRRR